MNHLEQLVAEWFEYQGYFVRRNVRVGKLRAGGYEGELDVVAFNPQTRRLVHVETTMDAHGWEQRTRRFSKKFRIGRAHIHTLFPSEPKLPPLDQIVVLGFGGRGTRENLGGGRIQLVAELLAEIMTHLRTRNMHREAVPEQYPLLRTLHFVTQHGAALGQLLTTQKAANRSP